MSTSSANDPLNGSHNGSAIDNGEAEDTVNGDKAEDDSDELRRNIRKGYRNLLEGIGGARGGNRDDGDGDRDDDAAFDQMAHHAGRLFGRVRGPAEAFLDAQVIKHLSRRIRRRAEGLSANSVSFRPAEFADKLVALVGGTSSTETGTGAAAMSAYKWTELGMSVNCLFPRVPSLEYLLGSFDPDPPETRTVRQRRERVRESDRDLVVTKSTQLTQAETTEENQTEKLVQSTFRQLIRAYKLNGKRPLCYFRFVVDPASFSATVSNVFHTSFLVKENKVRISVDPGRRLPVVEPISRAAAVAAAVESEDRVAEKRQVVVNLTMGDWRALTESLNITRAAIRHEMESDGGGDKRSRTS